MRDVRPALVTAVLGLSLAPHLTVTPWPALAWCGLVLVWQLGIWYADLPRPGKAVMVLLLCVGGAVAYLSLGRATHLSLRACTVFLVVLLPLNVLEMETRRDMARSIFHSVFLVLLTLIGHPRPLSLLYVLVMAVFSTSVLIRLHSRRSLKAPLRQAAVLLLKAVPVLLVLYFLFPRFDLGLDIDRGMIAFESRDSGALVGSGSGAGGNHPDDGASGGSRGRRGLILRGGRAGDGGAGIGRGGAGTGMVLYKMQRINPIWRLLLLFLIALILTAILNRRLIADYLKRRQDMVQYRYLQVCGLLARMGLPRQPDQGPMDYLAMVRSRRPDLAEGLEPVIRAYVRMRYSTKSTMTKAMFTRLVKQLVGFLHHRGAMSWTPARDPSAGRRK